MAMTSRTILRATPPHMASLSATLAPLLSAAGPNSAFHLRWTGTAVVIEQNSFAGVNLTAVDAAVSAAPVSTPQLDAQAEIDALPIYLRAIVLLLVEQLNVVRQTPLAVLPAITPAQAWQAIKDKAATL